MPDVTHRERADIVLPTSDLQSIEYQVKTSHVFQRLRGEFITHNEPYAVYMQAEHDATPIMRFMIGRFYVLQSFNDDSYRIRLRLLSIDAHEQAWRVHFEYVGRVP